MIERFAGTSRQRLATDFGFFWCWRHVVLLLLNSIGLASTLLTLREFATANAVSESLTRVEIVDATARQGDSRRPKPKDHDRQTWRVEGAHAFDIAPKRATDTPVRMNRLRPTVFGKAVDDPASNGS